MIKKGYWFLSNSPFVKTSRPYFTSTVPFHSPHFSLWIRPSLLAITFAFVIKMKCRFST